MDQAWTKSTAASGSGPEPASAQNYVANLNGTLLYVFLCLLANSHILFLAVFGDAHPMRRHKHERSPTIAAAGSPCYSTGTLSGPPLLLPKRVRRLAATEDAQRDLEGERINGQRCVLLDRAENAAPDFCIAYTLKTCHPGRMAASHHGVRNHRE